MIAKRARKKQKSKFSFTNWSVLEKKYAIVVLLLVTATLNNFFCPNFALTKTTQNSPLVCVAFVEKQEENKPRDDHIIIIMVKTKVKNRLSSTLSSCSSSSRERESFLEYYYFPFYDWRGKFPTGPPSLLA
jgi:hypothetical protein